MSSEMNPNIHVGSITLMNGAAALPANLSKGQLLSDGKLSAWASRLPLNITKLCAADIH